MAIFFPCLTIAALLCYFTTTTIPTRTEVRVRKRR
jgi:hypothetical protein